MTNHEALKIMKHTEIVMTNRMVRYRLNLGVFHNFEGFVIRHEGISFLLPLFPQEPSF